MHYSKSQQRAKCLAPSQGPPGRGLGTENKLTTAREPNLGTENPVEKMLRRHNFLSGTNVEKHRFSQQPKRHTRERLGRMHVFCVLLHVHYLHAWRCPCNLFVMHGNILLMHVLVFEKALPVRWIRKRSTGCQPVCFLVIILCTACASVTIFCP